MRIGTRDDARLVLASLSTVVLAATAVAAAASVVKSESWPVPSRLPGYSVLRVIDGDTKETEQISRVRYTGMDTPKSSTRRNPSST